MAAGALAVGAAAAVPAAVGTTNPIAPVTSATTKVVARLTDRVGLEDTA
jgi:hypothetical protein